MFSSDVFTPVEIITDVQWFGAFILIHKIVMTLSHIAVLNEFARQSTVFEASVLHTTQQQDNCPSYMMQQQAMFFP